MDSPCGGAMAAFCKQSPWTEKELESPSRKRRQLELRWGGEDRNTVYFNLPDRAKAQNDRNAPVGEPLHFRSQPAARDRGS